jgi:predicted lipoprotein with Yx(FWY)xxD motif
VGRLTAVALAVVAAAAAAVILLTRSSTPAAPSPSVREAPAASLRVAETRLGRILVTGEGRTLYLYIKDRGTTSACSARCARVWPPATVPGEPVAGPGVAAAKLSTTESVDHRRQLVYNGHPLYTLTADTGPGQINGQGFEGTWFVVSPHGHGVGQSKAAPAGY